MGPRIGVYICHCGTNIAGTVDVNEVTEFAKTLENVVIARDNKYMCSDPGQEVIIKDIKEYNLDRVVVASCSPRMHENTFRKACEKGGLNPYLFEMANIREHCSWVTEEKISATAKAKALVKAAVKRVIYHEPLEKKKVPINPATLVVGGGIAGIQAALEIADSGKKVYLVEKEPTIGGHMAYFDKTFPTLDCAACILTPKMVTVGQHPNIELLAYSEVDSVSGIVGNFKVKIRRKASYVDPQKCIGCGICYQKCPVKVPSEFDMKLGMRRAIYVPFPQAVPNIPVIDRKNCTWFIKQKCGVCKKVCPKDAINFDDEDKIIEKEVGNVIIATGYQVFDAAKMPQYGYGRFDNVISSLEFERMTNASGPTGGKVKCKDGSEPKSIAIIHCVGSRDRNFHDYCSRVCCMYSLKFAHLLKEKTDAEVYEFYIDMRAFGKGYEEFYERIQREGANIIRGKVAEVTTFSENGSSGKLTVIAEDSLAGCVKKIPVDMVILSVGLEASQSADKISKLFNISRGQDGFFIEKHPKLDPVATMTDGIFIAGCAQAPKDIPDSVAQASAASARVLSIIDKGEIEIEPISMYVNEEKCAGCKVCISLCPYKAHEFNEEKKVSFVNEALCKGCGTCAAACPNGAMIARHFTNQQILSEIEGILTD